MSKSAGIAAVQLAAADDQSGATLLESRSMAAAEHPVQQTPSAAKPDTHQRNLAELAARHAIAEEGGGSERRARERKAGKLSGGQQSQVALTLALARRPQLLVLDEPMAMLDPLARHDFMATVMAAIADDGLSVLLSSHVLTELERVADFLVLVSHGSVQVAGVVDDLLARHRVLTGPAAEADTYADRLNLVHAQRGEAQAHMLVRIDARTGPVPAGWEAHPVSLEELTLAYLREPDAAWLPGPGRALRLEPTEVAN